MTHILKCIDNILAVLTDSLTRNFENGNSINEIHYRLVNFLILKNRILEQFMKTTF